MTILKGKAGDRLVVVDTPTGTLATPARTDEHSPYLVTHHYAAEQVDLFGLLAS